jgi:AraC-like DNA-binding protein
MSYCVRGAIWCENRRVHSQFTRPIGNEAAAALSYLRNPPREVVLSSGATAELRCGCGLNHSRPAQCRAARKIESVIAHMAQHLSQPLRISMLCGLVGVSGSHFFAMFKSVTGSSPIDFFIHMRMERACALLREHPVSIKEAAAILGYNDPYYFSRLFKQVVGHAPSEYQRLPPLACPRKPTEPTAAAQSRSAGRPPWPVITGSRGSRLSASRVS